MLNRDRALARPCPSIRRVHNRELAVPIANEPVHHIVAIYKLSVRTAILIDFRGDRSLSFSATGFRRLEFLVAAIFDVANETNGVVVAVNGAPGNISNISKIVVADALTALSVSRAGIRR